MQVSDQQLEVSLQELNRWREEPVTRVITQYFVDLFLETEDTHITDCLVAGEPDKTHENVVELEARERILSELVDFLTGNTIKEEFLKEEEDEEED